MYTMRHLCCWCNDNANDIFLYIHVLNKIPSHGASIISHTHTWKEKKVAAQNETLSIASAIKWASIQMTYSIYNSKYDLWTIFFVFRLFVFFFSLHFTCNKMNVDKFFSFISTHRTMRQSGGSGHDDGGSSSMRDQF